jgi:hypothetical protein
VYEEEQFKPGDAVELRLVAVADDLAAANGGKKIKSPKGA